MIWHASTAMRWLKTPDIIFSVAELITQFGKPSSTDFMCHNQRDQGKLTCKVSFWLVEYNIHSVVFRLLWTSYIYFIWMERNERICKSTQQPPAWLVEKILYMTRSKLIPLPRVESRIKCSKVAIVLTQLEFMQRCINLILWNEILTELLKRKMVKIDRFTKTAMIEPSSVDSTITPAIIS